MTHAELITVAESVGGTVVDSGLDALETIYMNGFADDEAGDVDAPTGHVYRVAQWTVQTNSLGFSYVTDHRSEDAAKEYFTAVSNDYAKWYWEDED